MSSTRDFHRRSRQKINAARIHIRITETEIPTPRPILRPLFELEFDEEEVDGVVRNEMREEAVEVLAKTPIVVNGRWLPGIVIIAVEFVQVQFPQQNSSSPQGLIPSLPRYVR
jgi:hypothetical protein